MIFLNFVFFFAVVYYTYSLGLIVITTVITMTVEGMSTSNKPLPHKLAQFLHSRHMIYLGIKTNVCKKIVLSYLYHKTKIIDFLAFVQDMTTAVNCESDELKMQNRAYLNDRQKLAKVIDTTCFILFALVYSFLLLRFMP